MKTAYTVGQAVRIRTEWQDSPADASITYIVVENNGDRLLIEAQLDNWALKPVSLVRSYMIEVAE